MSSVGAATTTPFLSPLSPPLSGVNIDAASLLGVREWSYPALLQLFLSPTFDANEYVVAHSADVHHSTKTVAALNTLLNQINAELSQIVTDRHSQLLSSATDLTHYKSNLSLTSQQLSGLINECGRIKQDVVAPHKRLQTHARTLANITLTNDMTRQMHRLQTMTKRIRAAIATAQTTVNADSTNGDSDMLTEAAKLSPTLRECVSVSVLCNECETLLNECDLSGVDAVAADIAAVGECARAVESVAMSSCSSALKANNQSEIGTALQCAYSLGINRLVRLVDNVVAERLNALNAVMNAIADVSALTPAQPVAMSGKLTTPTKQASSQPSHSSPPSASTPSTLSSLRSALWSRVDGTLSTWYSILYEMYTFDVVLSKKRDAHSQKLVSQAYRQAVSASSSASSSNDTSSGLTGVFERFFRQSIINFSAVLEIHARNSAFIKTVFINEYYKLNKSLDGFAKRIASTCVDNQGRSVLSDETSALIFGSVDTYQSAYLTRAMSKWTDYVQQMFGGSHTGHSGTHQAVSHGLANVPTKNDYQTLMTSIHETFQQVNDTNSALQVAAVTNVDIVIQQFVAHLSRLVIRHHAVLTADELAMLNPHQSHHPVSNTERINIDVFTIASQCERDLDRFEIVRLYERLSPAAMDRLSIAYDAIWKLYDEIVENVFNTATSLVTTTVASLSHEDWNIAVSTEGSPYVETLKRQLTVFVRQVLPMYINIASTARRQRLLVDLLQSFANNVAFIFTRTAALSDLTRENVKIRLTADMTHIDSALTVLTGNKLISSAMDTIHQFKEIIFASDSTMDDLIQRGRIDRITLMHALLVTSGVPNITFPQTILGITLPQYVTRLNVMSADDVTSLFEEVFTAAESKLDIPSGPRGKTFISERFPRLHRLQKLIVRKETS